MRGIVEQRSWHLFISTFLFHGLTLAFYLFMGSVYARLGDHKGVAHVANSTELTIPRSVSRAFITSKILGGGDLLGVALVANGTH